MNRAIEIIQSEQQRKKYVGKEKLSLRDLCNTIKRHSIHASCVLRGENVIGAEQIFDEITAANIPNLVHDINLQIQEA